MGNSLAPRRRWLKVIAALGVAAIAVSACGGSSSKKGDGGTSSGVQLGQADNPTQGGSLTYALEAETLDFCLPKAQLAIAGVLVANSVYDTLTIQNADGEIVPFLAESVEPNADFTQWTIKLRDGIKFTNGEDLNADAVKLNMDAQRGLDPNIASLLFNVILNAQGKGVKEGDAGVVVVDPLTVQVNMNAPWADYPSFLWSFGRVGVVAPEQIKLGGTGGCETKMIGTGPFMLSGDDIREPLMVKNPNYWRKDAKGNQLPYLDSIQFRVQPDAAQRENGLEGDQFDLAQFSNGEQLEKVQNSSKLNAIAEPAGYRETGYLLIDNASEPFNNINARKAVFLAAQRADINQLVNKGLFELSSGLYDSEVPGYLSQEDSGLPSATGDVAVSQAEDALAAYKEETGKEDLSFEVVTTNDSFNQQILQILQQNLAEAGITMTIAPSVLQSEIINRAIGGTVTAFLWRNHPGQTCTWQRIWFLSGYPTNFAHISDPEVDAAYLDAIATDDPAQIKKDCEIVNKRMNEQWYNGWNWFTTWNLGAAKSVNGIYGPDLPDGSGPPELIGGFSRLEGLWKS